MRKSISIFSCFFLISLQCYAFTGTTTLTTWYPPPSASYNQVKFSTNNVAASNTPAIYCTLNNHTLFLNSTTNTIYQCTGAVGGATLYCLTASNGTMLADNSGTLHVCMNNVDTIYPPACYNEFCAYDVSLATAACQTTPTPSCCNSVPSCPSGFTQTAVDLTGDMFDAFLTSTRTQIISITCCSS
jgi:hypothetical protein